MIAITAIISHHTPLLYHISLPLPRIHYQRFTEIRYGYYCHGYALLIIIVDGAMPHSGSLVAMMPPTVIITLLLLNDHYHITDILAARRLP